VQIDLVQPAGHDVFVLGQAYATPRVQLLFEDGTVRTARPVHGFYLFAVPRSELRPTRQLAWVRGLNSFGYGFQRQGFTYRAG
jgi:hypothetical protein